MLLQEQAQTIFTVWSERSVVVDPHNSPFLFRDVQSYNTDVYADAASVHSQSEPASPQAVPNGTSAPATFLRFMCNDPMKNSAAGFVFGNDPATCDVYVQESLYVNKRLFAITINPNSGALIIKSLRKEGTLVESDSLGKLSLRSSRALIPGDICVTLTDVKIRITVLDQSDHADLHVPYLAQFYTRVTGSMPNLSALNLLSSGRYSGQQNRPYILNQELGRGAYGVVHHAIHSQTGNAFAAKQFQDRRVNPLKEAAILQSLSHVRTASLPWARAYSNLSAATRREIRGFRFHGRSERSDVDHGARHRCEPSQLPQATTARPGRDTDSHRAAPPGSPVSTSQSCHPSRSQA